MFYDREGSFLEYIQNTENVNVGGVDGGYIGDLKGVNYRWLIFISVKYSRRKESKITLKNATQVICVTETPIF